MFNFIFFRTVEMFDLTLSNLVAIIDCPCFQVTEATPLENAICTKSVMQPTDLQDLQQMGMTLKFTLSYIV